MWENQNFMRKQSRINWNCIVKWKEKQMFEHYFSIKGLTQLKWEIIKIFVLIEVPENYIWP